MDCERIDRIIDMHELDGLSGDERAALSRHRSGCRRCADALLSYEIMAGDEPPPARPGLFGETLASVAGSAGTHPAASRRAFGPGAFALAASAALVLLIGAGILLVDDAATGPGADRLPSIESAATPAATGNSVASRLRADSGPTALARFVEGRDYRRLAVAAPTSVDEGAIEVCEFFMWQCIHCFEFEPELESWAARQPESVRLVRVPAIWNEVGRLHARAFYTAELLGEGERVRLPFYEEFHERGNTLASESAIREFFVSLGIEADRFDAVFRSAAVQAEVDRAVELNRLYGVDSTPSIGVNGRYLTSPASRPAESRFAVVDALVEAEASASCGTEIDSACPLR